MCATRGSLGCDLLAEAAFLLLKILCALGPSMMLYDGLYVMDDPLEFDFFCFPLPPFGFLAFGATKCLNPI